MEKENNRTQELVEKKGKERVITEGREAMRMAETIMAGGLLGGAEAAARMMKEAKLLNWSRRIY